MIDDELHEPNAHLVTTPGHVVLSNTPNAELAAYKEQVELYERRAKFELTERELKIHDQLKSVISDQEDDYDSERDMLIFEEFLSDDSLSLPENESFHFDIP
nr:hypothetical protein [Tanacetum cinerariifolium]